MLKSIVSYLWGSREPEISLEDAFSVLNNVEENVEEQSQNDVTEDCGYACYHKTGVVTQVDDMKCLIDDTYEYVTSDVKLAVGTTVSFVAYTTETNVHISNVNILDNEWNCIEAKQTTWCNRCLVTKVAKRDGRNVFVSPGDVNIDLNSACIEFIPMPGDWLELDLKCEIDENVTDFFGQILEINKVRPLRLKLVQGYVKLWDPLQQTGTINNNIFFDREALYAGYFPSVGDKVVSEVIESDQGLCSWRSLKIIPHSIADSVDVIGFDSVQSDFLNEHDNVSISGDLHLKFSKMNDPQEFEFTICSTCNDLKLLDVKVDSVSGQCKLAVVELPLSLKPGEPVSITGTCTVKTAGESRETLTFVFTDFKIRRFVVMMLTHEPQIGTGRYSRKSNGKLYANVNKKGVIKGQAISTTPRFMSNRLLEYPIPQKLWDLFLKYECPGDNLFIQDELKRVKTVLEKSLRFEIYEDKFHTLLHLEDISDCMLASRFDQDRVAFIRNGEFLMLEIENLSERRPSIIAGDCVVARDAYSPTSTELEGIVHKTGAKHVYLKFAHFFHELYNGEDYSVRFVRNRNRSRRMHQATGLAIRNLGRHFLFPTKVVAKDHQVSFTYDKYELENHLESKPTKKTGRLSNAEILDLLRAHSETEQRELFHIDPTVKAESKLLIDAPPVDKRTPGKGRQSKFKLEWFDKSLNYYQKEAVRNILLGEARPLPYFIFGPPGTGKTVTLMEAVLQLLRLLPHSRLLIATPSNSAADLIALRLIDSGVLKPGDLVRIVSFKCICDNMIPAKLVPYCASATIGKEGTHSQNVVVTENGLTLGCGSSVVGRHRITIGTCVTVGTLQSMGFAKGHFTHILIDEAAQATEPEVMIPLSFLDVSSGQAILAGDPMQLGPILNSHFTMEFGLLETFMERMLSRFPYVRDLVGFPKTGGYDPRLVTRLVYNYRSLPEILQLSNSMFYFSELVATISPTDSAEAKLLDNIKDILPTREKGPPALVLHGVKGENYQTMDTPSWFNPHEASQVFYYLNELYRLGFTARDIGIISPYIKQVKQIRQLLTEAEFDLPKIGSVEEFQGQEFNIVLLSTVRSSVSLVESDKRHNLGFVANPRRLNVALTRARLLLIIVGNPHLLVTDPFWRNVVTYVVKNGSYCGCDLPSLSL